MTLKPSVIKLAPNNPRFIRDEKYIKLVKSLKDFPEMAKVRPIVVNKQHVILGGNMRFRAMKEAEWKNIPVTVVDWTEAKQREFIIKDNLPFGEWQYDILGQDYEVDELVGWGFDEETLTGDDFGGGGEGDGEGEGDKEKAPITCPKCGLSFTP